MLEEVVRKVMLELKRNNVDRFTPIIVDQTAHGGNLGLFPTIEGAISAAREGFLSLNNLSLQKRKEIIEAIREQVKINAKELAKLERDETRFGNYECKENILLLVGEKTPGPEFVQPIAISGDRGLTIIEHAPFGVIGSITPSTTPTATIVNNAIGMISAGNTVVFNAHPKAKKVSLKAIQLLNQTIHNVGGPDNLITGINEPTIESAQILMHHSDVDLLLVTGGPPVVRAAMQSGKRAICAGPGNPPAVVDETVNINKAAKDLVDGASFDNNLPCTCEKEVFVVDRIVDPLKAAMKSFGAVELNRDQIPILERTIFKDPGLPWGHALMNPDLIGQPASEILRTCGIPTDPNVKLIILEVAPEHQLVWTEQMMPVLPIVRVRDFQEAVELAYRAEQGFHHTASIHSLDIRNLSHMARVMNTALFIKNGPNYSGLGYGAEGYTSFSIGTFTREGLTTAKTFTWERRCVLVDYFRIV